MRSNICQTFLLISTLIQLYVQAIPDGPRLKTEGAQLRGTNEEDVRSLSGGNNGGGVYYSSRGYNQQYNNYRRNYYPNNQRYYGGGRNYGGYGYGSNQNYNNNNYQQYYDEDDNEGDNEQNDNEEYDDASANDGSTNDDGAYSNMIPSDIEEKFWQWYESPPSDWTGAQWAWFSGILSVTVAFMFCCCLGCANLCAEGSSCCGNKSDFDDYASIDHDKSGSFMTLNTKVNGDASTMGGSTNVSLNTAESDDDGPDDDATYDSIMRLRSTG